MKVRFEQALRSSIDVLTRGSLEGLGKVLLVRDLLGRIHLITENRPLDNRFDSLIPALAEAGGPFWSGHVLSGNDMIAPGAVFESLDLLKVGEGVYLLERGVTGAEWGRGPLPNRGHSPPRAAFFGLKGGVGRSTALCVWARHLATLGKRVLVCDLDLESPGVSSLLLPPEGSADYGIVDWFVEDAVGNVDNELLQLLVARSPAAAETKGEILVAPCMGTRSGSYLEKLSRVYVDVPGRSAGGFAERVAELIDQLEDHHSPDVVVLDSRAGLHDLAGVTTTRLDAMTFLFAGCSRQTWDGYRLLLDGWKRTPSVALEVRDRVRVVASLIPETGRTGYLEQVKQSSYDVFSNAFYEEAGAQDDVFNFDFDARDAPHDPLKIYWSRVFQDWDPVTDEVPPEQVHACYADFLERGTDLVLSAVACDRELNDG